MHIQFDWINTKRNRARKFQPKVCKMYKFWNNNNSITTKKHWTTRTENDIFMLMFTFISFPFYFLKMSFPFVHFFFHTHFLAAIHITHYKAHRVEEWNTICLCGCVCVCLSVINACAKVKIVFIFECVCVCVCVRFRWWCETTGIWM